MLCAFNRTPYCMECLSISIKHIACFEHCLDLIKLISVRYSLFIFMVITINTDAVIIELLVRNQAPVVACVLYYFVCVQPVQGSQHSARWRHAFSSPPHGMLCPPDYHRYTTMLHSAIKFMGEFTERTCIICM